MAVLRNGRTLKDFGLKVNGLRSFLLRDSKIIDYDYVRQCITRNLPVELRYISALRSIPSLVYNTRSFVDLAAVASEPDIEESLTDKAIADDPLEREVLRGLMDEWIFQDLRTNLTIHLIEASNVLQSLSVSAKDTLGPHSYLFVSFALHFGDVLLVPLRLSQSVPITCDAHLSFFTKASSLQVSRVGRRHCAGHSG